MSQTFVFDSRLPVSENMPANDPNHPKNVMRGALIVQNQAAADTKYDIYPPPRVEAFSTTQEKTQRVFFIAAALATTICLVLLTRAQPTVFRVILIFIVVVSIHYMTSHLQAL